MVRPIPLAILACCLLACTAAPASAQPLPPLVFDDGATHTADATWAGRPVVIRASTDGRPTTVRVPAGVAIESCSAKPGGTMLLDGGTLIAGGVATKGGILRLRGGSVGGQLWAI
jgi:hypothetical protein